MRILSIVVIGFILVSFKSTIHEIKNEQSVLKTDSTIQIIDMVDCSHTDHPIIAVANWSNRDIDTAIKVDWKKLGLESVPVRLSISIPEIQDYQASQNAVKLDDIRIPDKKGYIIVLKKQIIKP